jgi:hypothetical protein
MGRGVCDLTNLAFIPKKSPVRKTGFFFGKREDLGP